MANKHTTGRIAQVGRKAYPASLSAFAKAAARHEASAFAVGYGETGRRDKCAEASSG